jgi:flagella basal body P-ring formation protein FlgA
MKTSFSIVCRQAAQACAILLLSAVNTLACQAVAGDRITGKDLALADAAFSDIHPEFEIAPAPLAGVRRIFRHEEILKLAQQQGVAGLALPAEICFERVTVFLTDSDLLPVLQQSLAREDARIEILDHSRYAVPAGTLEFTRVGLSASGLWRGRITYGKGHSEPVWAKVRVTVNQTWVEASEPLVAGQLIEPRQLTVRSGPRFPFGVFPADDPDRVAGKLALRSIRAGDAIYASMLQEPREVERGDKVAVEVASGGAFLSFEATAESAGRAGETIVIRNPENGRQFQAKIMSKGKVSVQK